GAEDLVPFLKQNDSGEYLPIEKKDNGYTVTRYRPRIEGEFARIEKIHHIDYGIYWKVTTRENHVTIFGRSKSTRISNPNDETQVFQWMPEFSYDDKGNWIQYHYKKEDLENVPNELYEKNRINGTAKFTNTYLKRVKYGNRTAYYADPTLAYNPQIPDDTEHFFELVFDYGEHDVNRPSPTEINKWAYRPDAFSSYRSGFEIRINRLCKRVLMFHHFKDEKQFVGTSEEEVFGEDYLVRSLDLQHEPSSINDSGQSETTYLSSITQSGYIRKPDGTYSKKSFPPMEFSYQHLNWDRASKTVSSENIVNAPIGLSNNYQWVDLYNEGISGILSEQGESWFYKSNLGDANDDGDVVFSRAKKVMPKPSFTGISNGTLSIQDLAANGEKQVVVNSDGVKGYFELSDNNDWKPFQPFTQIAHIDLQDPNTRLLDFNGDGRAEMVITEENVFTWYGSDGKKGHLPSESTTKPFDEEQGPAVLFADQEQTIFLADMSGDGLTDIVRIRNGEICYWANKGYGTFSSKVTMGNAPLFDTPDSFNPQYLHLADVSGTGATDILYLGKNKFQAFINLSGNAWSNVHEIDPFFSINTNSNLSVIDLLGTGTSCIVWSSDLSADAHAPMRYIDLMGSKKPHVLVHYKNNLGKESNIQYKSSTHYYLKDKRNGKPWITKLPFPVQVVSKFEVKEKITDVRFTSEYKYHHGYYDHIEREFRGFGMVEQIDSEHYTEWQRNNLNNQLEASEELYQKPVLTKTWFHTGAFLDKEKILTHFKSEYWFEEYNKRFPSVPLSITEPELPDARLSNSIKILIADEYREALRACKGMILRKEIFALDAPEDSSDAELQLQMKPYSVSTHNCNIQLLQPRAKNEFGVFLVTESESITIEYERDETDFRLAHTINTKIDDLGNVLESASIVYGRQPTKSNVYFQELSTSVTDFSEDVLDNNTAQKVQLQNAFIDNLQATQNEQNKTHIIFTQQSFAKYNNGVKDVDDIDLPYAYRLRLPYETKTFELTGFTPIDGLFKWSELENVLSTTTEIGYHETPSTGMQRRLIENVKSKYLSDNLDELNFGFFDTLGLSYENYQLAFTPDLVSNIYRKNGIELQVDGHNVSSIIEAKGQFSNSDGNLWIRSGISHFKTQLGETITNVKERFFSPIAFEDPLGAMTSVIYDSESFMGTARNNDGYYLFIKSTTDAVENKVQIDVFNYRTMQAARMIDINANPSSILIDELGMVKATAAEGNGVFTDITRTTVSIIEPADSISALKEYTDATEEADVIQLFNSATYKSTNTGQLRQLGNNLIKGASIRFIYDFDRFLNTGEEPVAAASIIREEHFAYNNNSKIQFAFEYSDGSGKVAMTKVQAKPGMAFYMENGERNEKDTGGDLRWIGNGRTVLNNKGNPVKKYEPYFSPNFLYEDAPELVEIGVTPVLHYDSMGRVVKTVFPDGTFSKVTFNSWQLINFDQNDTVLESDWYNNRINNLIDSELIAIGKDPNKEKQAAQKAAVHANTPSSVYLDSLGRPVLSITHNGKDKTLKERLYPTFIRLDIEGNTRAIVDARGNTVMEYKYDMLGQRIYSKGMDAGTRWILTDVLSNPIHRWDSRNHVFSFDYDIVHRPKGIKVQGGDGVTTLDNIYELNIYGEGQIKAYESNLRGQVFQQYDTAGRVQNLEFDFKGNVLETRREYNANYKDIPNWITSNLDNTTIFDSSLTVFSSQIEYDALNLAINTITPDGSETKPVFNEAGLLNGVAVDLLPANGVGAKEKKSFVKTINYDAKGQREQIVYGDRNGNNLATSTYKYDEETFRLLQIRTIRGNGDMLQDLYYTYDPVGNITEIEDKAIPTRFFNNFRIEPKGLYVYDALNRLIEAQGKEHAGQAINFGSCDHWEDQNFKKFYSSGDDMAWRKYTQKYSYDPVGNILETKHKAVEGNWTRHYVYQTSNNRLTQTQVGGQTYNYPHHPQHGTIMALPHLSLMKWNFKDELVATAKQEVCNNNYPSETTFYVYDANGKRVRKITENDTGSNKKEERLYIGGIEIYKKYTGNYSGLERVTLHVMDDMSRIAMVDTRNMVNDDTDQRTVRFQFNNHLGSAHLELDDNGAVISYEEYHPYGTTAYKAINKDIKAEAKRYKYTGMERDAESGFSYHSARYYLPWLGRWLSADPIGIEGGVNLYGYANANPVNLLDTSGMAAGSYQKRFNKVVAELIVKSGNQGLIDHLLVKDSKSKFGYKLNTDRATGYNAGHTSPGDRVSANQELGLETAIQNQNDGWALEADNPGMSKANVEVDIGNGIKIPIERKTAADLETAGLLPAGASDAPNARGWTRKELNAQVEAARSGKPSPSTNAQARWGSNAGNTPNTQQPSADSKPSGGKKKPPKKPTKLKAPRAKAPKAGPILGVILAVGVLFHTGDVYAAVQTANPAASTTDAVVQGGGAEDVGIGLATDAFYATPAGMVVGAFEASYYGTSEYVAPAIDKHTDHFDEVVETANETEQMVTDFTGNETIGKIAGGVTAATKSVEPLINPVGYIMGKVFDW
ncbi:MAG: SpvB/TcaC N-terminal domain-containing protein, partial [Bacteroidota bacterium]